MPPRHAYWTILIGNAPTAFRAHDRADLLPTFERLRQKQPDVTMKYFARGRLWESPEQARSDTVRRPAADARGREWRPGGTHRDPRDRFKTKREKPRGEGERRDRPRPTEHRGSWAPKRKPFAKPPGFAKPQPFGTSKPTGAPKPFGPRKPFGPPKPSGAPKPFGGQKPFGAAKSFGDRKRFGARRPFGDRPPARERPFEPKPTAESPKEDRADARRKDGTRRAKKSRR